MKKNIIPLLTGSVLLTGCAGANSDFECNATSSDSCMTIDAANNMARYKASEAPLMPGTTSLPARTKSGPAGGPFTSTEPRSAFLSGPVRTHEITGKVWVAPWIDGQNIFHEPGLLSFVLKSGEWRQ